MRIDRTTHRRSRLSLLLATLLLVGCWAGSPARAQEVDEQDALVFEAHELLDRLDRRNEDIREWTELRDRYEGDDRRAIDLELADRKLLALADLYRVAQNVVAQETQGLDTSEIRRRVEPAMHEIPAEIRSFAEQARTDAAILRLKRDEAGPDELLDLEQRIARADQRIHRIIRLYLEHLQAMESMKLDTSAEKEWFLDAVTKFADFLARRIEVVQERQSQLAEQLDSRPGDAALASEIDAATRRLEGNVDGLRTTLETLDELGVDTTEYQQQLAQATGDIIDLLETDVAVGLLGQWIANGRTWLAENGAGLILKIIVFIVIVLVFRMLARLAREIASRSLAASKFKISRLLGEMITSTIQRLVLILGLLVALSQLGFDLTPLLAGLGVAGFIIGFALQDVLSNFASGVMILFYRPFDVDDLVEVAGAFGKVSRMTLVSTTILTLDHQTLIVPNSKIWGDTIKNVTAQKIRRVDMTFGISYEDDIPNAEATLQAIVGGHPKVLEDPEPIVKLHTLGESSVDFVVRPWVSTDDYWDVYWDITREVKMRFDAEGISIPFPQRDVHLYPRSAEALPPAS